MKATVKREEVASLRGTWQKEHPSILYIPQKQSTAGTKRIFDAGLSLVGIILSLPLGLLIALSIFLEDGFPIFYPQERVGKDCKIFHALKFRTMKRNAEDGLGPVQASPNDPRITRVGKILRKTALDELPQLWNIWKGEMSFVGPRPLRPGEIFPTRRGEQIRLENIPGFKERCLVVPGLTGLAQVYAPRDIEHRNKFRFDLLYVKKKKFLLDLKLLALSFLRTLRGAWQL